MSGDIVVTNTLGFRFPDDAAQPTLAEMARFVKELAGTKGSMDTAYKNAEEKSVFIKYKSEEGMKEALDLNRKKLPFHNANGKTVVVRMSVAGRNTQYIRVFDLPPEASDNDLSLVLSKYGKIARCVREKFPPEHELELCTGVRGVYMDVENQIPPVLYFKNKRGRVSYNGNKLKCFACGQEGHQKMDCGNRKDTSTKETVASAEQNNSTFAAVLAEAGASDTQTVNLKIEVLEEEENEAEEEKNKLLPAATSPNVDTDNGGQQNKQQQTQTILHYQQRPKQMVGNWTEYVKIHTKMMKEQRQQQKNSSENSPPRKTSRPNSQRSGSGSE